MKAPKYERYLAKARANELWAARSEWFMQAYWSICESCNGPCLRKDLCASDPENCHCNTVYAGGRN